MYLEFLYVDTEKMSLLTTDAIKLVSSKHALLPRQWSNVLTSNTMVTRLETKLASPIPVLLDNIQKLQLKSKIG
jgi:hypothetical protein